ncbi:DUF2690 domain-containing protein [Streptomyces sp. NPDC127114]|uniref:DUF2690 domain-containing protein n=1 Tax=Streptomyces sp. NPDC127114 TaxID=3345366 RepID=UPI003638EB75
MRRFKLRVLLALTASLAGLAVALPQAAQAQQVGTCVDGQSPFNLSGTTVRELRFPSGSVCQLRYDSDTTCAWGRIVMGRVGDTLWVDRAWTWQETQNGGWQPWLGYTSIRSGGSVYTTAWDDDGHYMRACGESQDHLACTGWY